MQKEVEKFEGDGLDSSQRKVQINAERIYITFY